MAEQTVREQLAEALEMCNGALKASDELDKEVLGATESYLVALTLRRTDAQKIPAALARHRAEPPADFEPCNCDGPDCPGYELGLEAQRERVG